MNQVRYYITGRNDRVMKLLLLGLVLFQGADGALTNLLIRFDVAREGNPLLIPIAGSGGFLLLKVAGGLACAAILWRIYHRKPRLALAATAAFTGAYFLIASWNLALLTAGLALA